ncbi:MAG: NAD(P)H-dependent oxidoreductase [Burkholderiaceae bacterium]
MTPRLLIVWHSRTEAAHQMAQAMARGAQQTALACEAPLEVTLRAALETSGEDMLNAQGYLFCAPENLGALSGEMKAFFDRRYYDVLDRVGGRPYGLAVSAGTDGQGAVAQATRICTGWRLRKVAEPLVIRFAADTPQAIWATKTLANEDRTTCEELGGLMAATLLLGA